MRVGILPASMLHDSQFHGTPSPKTSILSLHFAILSCMGEYFAYFGHGSSSLQNPQLSIHGASSTVGEAK
jgi:hypothetical protein